MYGSDAKKLRTLVRFLWVIHQRLYYRFDLRAQRLRGV